ncbi:Glycosyltransferase involved in cell wall bisynthesis [Dyella marensis]|uniref:Glycosyltransferase involved in cell wall bisynthesis n=2 Tax=Rhodanobacteraceae TaxID=1775411 RepID=A0A1I2IJU8_9GAMM|nr:Glycosyltransferase involved in cell wall bisynthesis [Dyella marensis]
MRVLMVSTSYPKDLSDWKGVFIRDMARSIAAKKDIELHLWAPPGTLPDKVQPAATPTESAWLDQLMAAGGVSHLMRQGGLASTLAPAKLLYLLWKTYRRHANVDVYHLNWLQCALPLPNNGKPALLTVLGNDLKLMNVPLVRSLLRRNMRSRPVAICPNAEWMRQPLEAAFGDIAQIKPVSFGIAPHWYEIERSPASPHQWLAVTRLTANKLGPLFEWSAPLFAGGERELHLFGPMQEQIEVPRWVHYHGSATPQELASTWFPRATGLVTLSRHAEGRPQVMLEAMASGLPIVASDMPAHASIVENHRSGRLCDTQGSFEDAIRQLEDPAINAQYGAAARAWARDDFGTWDDCAGRYVDIYQSLLTSRHA